MDKIRQLNINMPKLDLRNMKRRSVNDMQPPSPKVKIIRMLLFISAIFVLSALTFYAYLETKPVSNVMDLPLVERSILPLRTQPSESGGLIVSNQNKAIYKQLKKSEQPQSYINDSSQKQVSAIVEKYFSKTNEKNVEPVKLVEEKAVEASKSNDIFALIDQEKASVKNGKVKLRIAVLKTHSEADKEWSRLVKKMKFLQGQKHKITEKIAKNGNKMFYLWIVNLEEGEGKDLCEKLKQSNQECFVIYE